MRHRQVAGPEAGFMGTSYLANFLLLIAPLVAGVAILYIDFRRRNRSN